MTLLTNNIERITPDLPSIHIKMIRQSSPDAPVALLIHGLSSSSKTWMRLSKDLYNKGYSIAIPDLPGHGLSPRAENYSTEKWADALIETGIKPALIVGHSMGGLIACHIQSTLKAEKLILVDPVFQIPASNVALPLIRLGFYQSVKYNFLVQKTFFKKATQKRHHLQFLFGFNKWDKNSLVALVPHPKLIAQRLLKGEEQILVLRPKGSLIFPYRHFVRKNLPETVVMESLRRGHNTHVFHYEDFWIKLENFLEGTVKYG